MKRFLIITLAVSALVCLVIFFYLKPSKPPASQAFINGKVVTMDSDQRIVEAVLIENDRITAVGSKENILALTNSATIIHDIQGKTLLPGFIDAHGHFPGSGLSAVGVDLNSPPIGNTENINELIQQLKAKADNTAKGEWIFGFGYDDTQLADNRHPTLNDLDKAAPNNPVFIMHISGHMGVANSQALALANIDNNTIAAEGGIIQKDAQGQLTGLLEENAATPVQTLAMDFSPLDFLKMVDAAAAEYASVGVTTAQSGGADSRMTSGLKLAAMLNKVPFRLEIWPFYNELGADLLANKKSIEEFESDKVKLGAIKIIADGSIQGYTGFLSHPYHEPYQGDTEYRGYPRVAKEELNDWVMKFHRAGFQLAIHGNGDAAIDNIIEAFELAQQAHPAEDPRLILVHSQMARDDQLVKMKQLGITPTFFSAHTYYWGDRHRDIFMGPERAKRMSPARSALAIDLKFTTHLDTPVVPMNPLLAVWSTVKRRSTSGEIIGSEQTIDLLEGFKAITQNAAWQIKKEDQIGSIEKGKLADLVILKSDITDQNFFSNCPPSNNAVLATFVGGVEIFRSKSADPTNESYCNK